MSSPKSILKTGTVGSALQRRRSVAFNKSVNKATNSPTTPSSDSSSPEKLPASSSSLNPEKLPASTVPGWINKRPESLKGVFSRTPDPKINAVLERARAARKKKLIQNPGSKPYLDELIIVGERVRLNEIGYDNSDLRHAETSADTIFFSPSYFPYENDVNKIILAKTTFSKVFAPGSKFNAQNPLPPCATSEFKLLKEGLTNRLYNIRMSLPAEAEDIVPMDVRTTYHIAEEINAIIQAIEDQKTNCTDYHLNLATGTADQIPGYGKPISRADTERMQNLLRQFSFLILQSMNPVSGYEDNEGNIKANFLINALEEQQISKEDMDHYLAEYGAQHEIPDTISQALQSTDSQDNVYSLMLESEIQNLIQYVKDNLSKNLVDLTLRAEFNAKTKELENSPARGQIMGMLNWLLEKYSANKKLIADNIGAINNHQITSGVLTNTLKGKNDEIFKLESDLEGVNKQLTSALVTIGNLQSSKKPTAPVPVDNTVNELRETLAERTGQRDVIAQELKKENENLKSKIIELEKLQHTSGVLGSALSVSVNPKQIPFIRRVESIVNAVKSKKPYKLNIKSPFQELYNKLNEHGENLSDICEFTYVASFFLKKIFSRNSKLYELLNTVIDTYLKQNPDVLDNTMSSMSNLLEASENQTISGVGYYTIPEIENMKQLKPLQEIINNLESDTNNACNNAFNASFPRYNKNNTKFIVPNGFIIGPLGTGPINKYELSEGKFVKNGTIQNNFPKSISYKTFFILYILFIKSYLVTQKDDKTCPRTKILTDSQYFSRNPVKPTVQETVKPTTP